MTSISEIRTVLNGNDAEYREILFELLRKPTISATGEGMEAFPDTLCSILEQHGFSSTKRIPTDTYDLVYGEQLGKEDRPTILFYGHYDVQPAEEDHLWKSDPFEPTVRDGAVYARGSGDNKGQLITHVFGLDIATTIDPELPVNVKIILEGGEESGSIGLQSYLETEPSELQDVDVGYVADGPMHASGNPTVIYGNRGLLAVELKCETTRTNLHSGNYGGPLPNAANTLSEVLGSLLDGNQPTIDGFGEAVDIPETARALVQEIPYDEQLIERETGVSIGPNENYYEQLLLEPTITVNGLESGYRSDGIKTIIPNSATAKIDFRLVPDQRPIDIFNQFKQYINAQSSAIEVTNQGMMPPMQTSPDHPIAQQIRDVLTLCWEQDIVEMPLMGGSLPSAYLQRALDIPVFIVPYANPDQGNHGPNEHLELDCFRCGIATSAALLIQLGSMTTDRLPTTE